jgi:hypothetical protein
LAYAVSGALTRAVWRNRVDPSRAAPHAGMPVTHSAASLTPRRAVIA